MNRQSLFTIVVVTFMALSSAMASVSTHEVQAPIDQVTVYPGRAKVSRVADLDLPAGDHSVLIKSLPVAINVSSLRASVRGVTGITFTGLNHSEEHHIATPQKKVAELESQIRDLESGEMQMINDRLAAFEAQKKLLGLITTGSGQQMSDQVANGGLNVAQWQAAFDFVGDRQREVADSIRVATNEKASLSLRLEKLRDDLEAIRSCKATTTRTVQIDLNLANPGPVEVTLEYMIGGAGWKPLYDARLVGDEPVVQLGYFAEVTQHTGEDWNDVELSLSTVEPSHGAGPPELSPWYLSVREIIAKQPVTRVDDLLHQVAGVVTNASGEVFIRGGRAGEVAYIVDGTPIGDPLGGLSEAGAHLSLVSGTINTLGTYSTTFKVVRHETVPSAEKSVRVGIAQLTFKGTMELVCRPKLREGVYRIVSMTNGEKIPLMPGQVSVFAESDYLGSVALMQLIVPGQEFELPFGLDNAVEVEHEIRRHKVGRKDHWLTGDEQQRHETEIEIKLVNNSRISKSIKIEEALPVSQDERIKVKVADISPKADIDDTKKKATWTVSLEPGAEQSVTFRYRIEHPVGMQVVGM